MRENCSMIMKTVCNEVCKEECEVKDKKVCMTIPHQECRETSQQVCKDIPRSECKKVTFLSHLIFIHRNYIVLQIFYHSILYPFIHELQNIKDINDKMKFTTWAISTAFFLIHKICRMWFTLNSWSM